MRLNNAFKLYLNPKRAADTARSLLDQTPSKPLTKAARLYNSPKSLEKPSQPTQSHLNPENPGEISMVALYEMMKSMQSQLSKLDKLDLIEYKINEMEIEVLDFKSSLNFLTSQVIDLKISSKQSKEKIQEAKRKVEQLEQNNDIVKKEIIDQKARSMHDNLFFLWYPRTSRRERYGENIWFPWEWTQNRKSSTEHQDLSCPQNGKEATGKDKTDSG